MKTKKLIVVGIILIIVILITGIILIWQGKSSKQLELTYKINAGIPFNWEYEIADPSIVEFVKSYQIKNENKGSIVGAPIYTNYVFEGLKEGKTTITFKLVNITDGTIDKEEKYFIKVDNNKNILLITKKE